MVVGKDAGSRFEPLPAHLFPLDSRSRGFFVFQLKASNYDSREIRGRRNAKPLDFSDAGADTS